MIDLNDFITCLTSHGLSLAAGVPCSYFAGLLHALNEHDEICYIPATREDEAMGIACGYVFGGGRCLVVMQNSGFANIGDALTSLAQLYEVPILLLISHRGLADDATFPEHYLMGEVTYDILRAYRLPYWVLTEDGWQDILEHALTQMVQTSRPVCLLVGKGVLCE